MKLVSPAPGTKTTPDQSAVSLERWYSTPVAKTELFSKVTLTVVYPSRAAATSVGATGLL